jgi:hypothetical protein
MDYGRNGAVYQQFVAKDEELCTRAIGFRLNAGGMHNPK